MAYVKLAVVGRTLNDKRWDLLYEMIEDGIQNEFFSGYDKYNVDSAKKIDDADAYIYVATTPKVKDRPFVHLQASATEDDIEESIMRLVNQIKALDRTERVNEFIDDSNTEVSSGKIDGLVLEINGKEVSLDKQDFIELKEMLRLCEVFNFHVKEVKTIG